MPTILITGANRGLGFNLLKLLAADSWRIYACCRNPDTAEELNEIADLYKDLITIHRLDVEDHAAIDALATELKGIPIDILLNNAGYFGFVPFPCGGAEHHSFGKSNFDDWAKIYRINVIGPMKMAEAFIDNVSLSERKIIITLTSRVGSMTLNKAGGLYGYRASKAAANSIMKSMGLDLKTRGIIALPLHPGFVRTDMSGPGAEIDVMTSVVGIKRVIERLTLEDGGRFLGYDGAELPW